MKQILAVVGPTGVGKSDLAIRLAEVFPLEIINADSRQVYRHMDVGTSKPVSTQLKTVPHHLFDIIDPDQSFSLAEFQKLALAAMDAVLERGNIPVLVGGSGQYVWAVLENWSIPAVAPDELFRRQLEKRTEHGEADALFKELQEIDNVAAGRIDRRNIRRVIRALELKRAGSPTTVKRESSFSSFIVGLTAERKHLYDLIDRRVDTMVAMGLVEEVKSLLEAGYSVDLPALSGIGYRQITRYIHGEIGLEEAVRSIKTSSHRLARQQYNWFKLKDDRINWFDLVDEPYPQIVKLVEGFLKKD